MSTTPGHGPQHSPEFEDDLIGGKNAPRDPQEKGLIGYEPLTKPLATEATRDEAS